jgi:cytochrome c oxidase assembly protein subunit 11
MATASLDRRNLRIGLIAGVLALAMLGLGFAAVPLYRIFCQVTGLNGTTQRATEAQAFDASRMLESAGAPLVSIRFDANTASDMPWLFRPEQVTQTVQIGERSLAIFEAKNLSSVPVTGQASFNVQPAIAGKYFNKIQCFCFTEQTLKPGQSVHMPVIFFVDPAALKDPDMKGVEQITLSYTFHRAAA